jgi:nuclear pore complex protein Nup155
VSLVSANRGGCNEGKADSRCDPDIQGLLSRMTYKDFLTTPDGRKVSRQLVTNLIEQQIGQEHGVSSVSRFLCT